MFFPSIPNRQDSMALIKHARESMHLFSFSYTTIDDGRAISLAFVLPENRWKSENVSVRVLMGSC